ncbi:uncharacterized protein PG998_003664 [Apiospora kogelbergensis]|uniref:uncharacterized protein n=1 Tax=Apiospora kogelbergensis TaxID=1337665 RepID=UPI00312E738B
MAYALATHYAGQALLDGFSFFTGKDPSNGFVNYQSQAAAVSQGLVKVDGLNRVRLGVDTYNNYTVSDAGRPSVRLTSYQGFTHGLFIADFDHMPASTCGVWPAFWAFNNGQNGEKWPPGNIGCNYAAPTSDAASYGDSFNAQGGGVYALEWDSGGLKVWHFPRSNIPSDIAFAPLTSPDPKAWGPPQALSSANLCGDYAGNVWGVADKCNTLAPTCKEYVASRPEAFLGAFWNINYIDVYQKPDAPKPSSSSSSTASSTSLRNATSISTRIRTISTTGLTLPSTINQAPISNPVPPSNTRTITLITATPSPVPAGPGGGLGNPAILNGYTLLGCFASGSGYPTWTSSADFATMDNEACVASCAGLGRKYSGVYATTCYCADNLGDASAVDNAQCDRACPGNPNQRCGGLVKGNNGGTSIPRVNSTAVNNSTAAVSHPLGRRAAPANILLTVYGNIAAAPPPAGAPAMGGSSPAGPGPSGAATGSGGNSGGNVTITTAVTMTYTTVCATNPALLVAVPYCTTMTITQCASSKSPVPTAPGVAAVFIGGGPFLNGTRNGTAPVAAVAAAVAAIPMCTYAETCSACGPRGANTVTLTVPMAVATAAAANPVVTEVTVAKVVPVIANANANKNTIANINNVNNVNSKSNSSMRSNSSAIDTRVSPVTAGASSVFGDDFVGVTGMMLSLAVLGAVFLL